MDRNLLEIDPSEIKDVRVLATVIGGRFIYAAPDLENAPTPVYETTTR